MADQRERRERRRQRQRRRELTEAYDLPTSRASSAQALGLLEPDASVNNPLAESSSRPGNNLPLSTLNKSNNTTDPDRGYYSISDEEIEPSQPLQRPYSHYSGATGLGYDLGETYSPDLNQIRPVASYGYSTERSSTSQRAYGEAEHDAHTQWGRQQIPSSGLRRTPTRRIKLVNNSVLSINYPVPSAVKNATQAKYRANLTDQEAEEFRDLRCNGPAPRPWTTLTTHRYSRDM